MKFTFLTYGTEGDTRPLVALASALIARGHQAQLLADISTGNTAAANGVPFIPLAGDMKATVLAGGALEKIMQDGGDVTRMTKACAKIAQDNTAAWMATTQDAARDSDVLVFSGLASYAGLAVAEHLALPCIGAGLWPMTPTRDLPCAFLRPRALPGWLNRLSHQAFGSLSWAMFKPAINGARRQVFGQGPRRRMWRDYPILYGCSPSLVPPPADWPPHIRLCGAWNLPATDWQAPPALTDFLAAGAPPIYIGFGSMAGFDRKRVLDAMIAAVGGRRAVFYPGWSGITARLPDNFHVLGDTPHDWLFPRCSLIIHHGGAGTTHTAARSGQPAVVIPFAGDQFFWADRVVKAGIGSACTQAGKLDGATLQALITSADTAPVRQRAAALGEQMRAENGVAAALEDLLHGVPAKIS